MDFKNLHSQNDPLLICNVWDAASAKIAEKLNFQAIGTSSAAIATLLGYKDGENMTFAELSYFVERITASTKLPLSVDLESGYSKDPSEIVKHIKKLASLGVVGINIEDSVVDKERMLLNAEEFAETVATIKERLQKDNTSIFINVRTDSFLLQQANALNETNRRIQLFEEAGADGIFIPFIEKQMI